jgi:hypothetical protein
MGLKRLSAYCESVKPKQSREVMMARRELDNALRLLAQAGEKLASAAALLDKTGDEESQTD